MKKLNLHHDEKKLSETDSPEVMEIIQKHGKKIMEMK